MQRLNGVLSPSGFLPSPVSPPTPPSLHRCLPLNVCTGVMLPASRTSHAGRLPYRDVTRQDDTTAESRALPDVTRPATLPRPAPPGCRWEGPRAVIKETDAGNSESRTPASGRHQAPSAAPSHMACRGAWRTVPARTGRVQRHRQRLGGRVVLHARGAGRGGEGGVGNEYNKTMSRVF